MVLLNENLLDVGRMLARIDWPHTPVLDAQETKQKWCDHIRDRAAGKPGTSFTHHEIDLLMACGGLRDYMPADICAILGLACQTSYSAAIGYARFEVHKREMMNETLMAAAS